jgi:hypothetical protein
MVAPDGAWFLFSHDQAGRLAQTSACAQVPSAPDPRDPATPLDACVFAGGPPLSAWVPVGSYSYDAAGLATQVAMPSGQHRSWTRAPNGSGVVTAYRQVVDQQVAGGEDLSDQ